jgi:alpha-D-ribose 1-methylphosphonate 5-triphosphate synthase subunit PhnH
MQSQVEGGFAEPVFEAQSAFRAIMEALSRPGLIQPLRAEVMPPAPLPRGVAAVALTLCDHDTPVWLDPVLAASDAVAGWLRFHTGAPLVSAPGDAQFALATALEHLPPLADFGQGSDEYPDRSTTLVVAPGAPKSWRLAGPGIKHSLVAELGIADPGFAAQWLENRARFPRGIDLLLAADDRITGLPRTTRLTEV